MDIELEETVDMAGKTVYRRKERERYVQKAHVSVAFGGWNLFPFSLLLFLPFFFLLGFPSTTVDAGQFCHAHVVHPVLDCSEVQEAQTEAHTALTKAV